ncbi:MAG: ferritin-like domain-containing protein [Polyangiaceae bacterium]|nr:ferritin-like domain-containing protein [Polyangiaceae bacterium]
MAYSSNRRRRVLELAAVAAAAAALFPNTAQAQEVGGGAGLYVSFTFGAERLGVGYGLEGHFLGVLDGRTSPCGTDGRKGLGGLFQVGGINADTFRFVAAAHGGGEPDGDSMPGFVGELGLAGHYDGEISLGVHTGFLVQSPIFMTAFVRAEWLLDEYSVGTGVRALPTFGWIDPSGCSDGRPLRDDAGLVQLPKARRRHDIDVAGRRLRGATEHDIFLAEVWSNAAQAEAASVPAFLQLAAELIAYGAPDTLVSAALDAARDEIFHAELCAEVASRHAGVRVRPVLPAAPARRAIPGRDGLARLALESWVDGCLGEGAAAGRAMGSARIADDPATRRAHARIARDEARHAELGWRILTWALATGGSETKDVVHDARRASIANQAEDAPPCVRRAGYLGSSRIESIHAKHERHARRRLDTVLASR